MSNENNPSGSSTPGAGGAHENFESSKAHAKQATDHLKAAAQAKVDELRDRVEDYCGQARERAEDYYGQAREQAKTFQEEGEAYVRQNPMRAVVMALGAGFVLGLIFRK